MLPLPPRVKQALERQGEGLNVLVLRLGAMGDILRTVPPVRLLRRDLPHAEIYWVLEESWRVVLQGHPDLDGILCMPRGDWRRLARAPSGWPELWRSLREFRARMRERRPDLVLDFHGNLRSGLTGWMSGGAVRLGYAGHQQKEGNRWFNTHHRPSGERRASRMERNLDLIRGLGIADRPLPPAGLPLVETGAAAANRIVVERFGSAPFAVLSPGASRAQAHKKPPARLLSEASRELTRHGVRGLVVWGPGEESDARGVAEDATSGATLAPPTDLPTLGALLHRARLFVGGDSGPLHLACAVGCPVLGLYGPTDPEVNRPWGVVHRTVWPEGRAYTGIKRKDRRAGFEGLDPRRVRAAVIELLEQPRDSG